MKRLCMTAASAVALLIVLCAADAVNAQVLEEKKIVDRIIVMKSARTMTLERGGQPIKTYKVALGGQPVGAKQQ
jgi:opacity protein-like surface antigen